MGRGRKGHTARPPPLVRTDTVKTDDDDFHADAADAHRSAVGSVPLLCDESQCIW